MRLLVLQNKGAVYTNRYNLERTSERNLLHTCCLMLTLPSPG